MQGIANGAITHKGPVKWQVQADGGGTVTIEECQAYYCKQAPYQLMF
jgi:hypothetical protein